MLNQEIKDILSDAKGIGWVLEPEAKRLFSLAGLNCARHIWTKDIAEGVRFAHETGYPVVAKVVSPKVIHKSDASGVILNISNDDELGQAFQRLSRIEGYEGVIVEESLKGIELIIGAAIDSQFGPVVLLGIGGTSAEIYKDVSLRMAPVCDYDVESMIDSLKGRKFIEGYRGSPGINKKALTETIVNFSRLLIEIQYAVESIDLNPVICTPEKCIIADARIMLKQ